MRRLGHAPSVRLFESASCGAAIISDTWDGLDEFLTPDSEVLLASSGEDVEQYLRDIPDAVRLRIGDNARHRILGAHTAGHRAAELERYVAELVAPGTRPSPSEAAADWARPS
jgi:spore maturation protein CgeB